MAVLDTIPTRRRTGPDRLFDVARLHTTAWPLLVAWPVTVVAASFAIAIAIFAAVGDTGNQTNFTGGVISMYCFALAFYVQAGTQTFPFALGLSVTRREYFAATTLVAAAQSVVLGTGLYLLALVERATDGWGLRMRMFDVPAYWTDNPVLQLLLPIVAMFALASVGLLIGAVLQRFRTTGLLAAALAVIALTGVVAIVITWQGWWGDIGHWVVDIPRSVPLLLAPLLVAAVALGAAWATLRRAAPEN